MEQYDGTEWNTTEYWALKGGQEEKEREGKGREGGGGFSSDFPFPSLHSISAFESPHKHKHARSDSVRGTRKTSDEEGRPHHTEDRYVLCDSRKGNLEQVKNQ